MEIIRARVLGFCSGVRRAVKAADSVLSSRPGGSVYSLGPLIHNPLVLGGFARRGLKILSEDGICSLSCGDAVVVRAHGVSPELMERIARSGAAVVDATCPLVTQSQRRVADFASRGFSIVFAGDANHGEVVGIEGWARKAAAEQGRAHSFFLVKDDGELSALLASGAFGASENVALLCQTTFSVPVFRRIVALLKESVPSAEVVDSICPATHERQDALESLCEQVGAVVVIGGKASANTGRLLRAAVARGKKAFLVESADDISPRMREELGAFGSVGISAGASTPDDVIDRVEQALRESRA